jgi:hypothetical protein
MINNKKEKYESYYIGKVIFAKPKQNRTYKYNYYGPYIIEGGTTNGFHCIAPKVVGFIRSNGTPAFKSKYVEVYFEEIINSKEVLA